MNRLEIATESKYLAETYFKDWTLESLNNLLGYFERPISIHNFEKRSNDFNRAVQIFHTYINEIGNIDIDVDYYLIIMAVKLYLYPDSILDDFEYHLDGNVDYSNEIYGLKMNEILEDTAYLPYIQSSFDYFKSTCDLGKLRVIEFDSYSKFFYRLSANKDDINIKDSNVWLFQEILPKSMHFYIKEYSAFILTTWVPVRKIRLLDLSSPDTIRRLFCDKISDTIIEKDKKMRSLLFLRS